MYACTLAKFVHFTEVIEAIPIDPALQTPAAQFPKYVSTRNIMILVNSYGFL
jgi:hypothetical protein